MIATEAIEKAEEDAAADQSCLRCEKLEAEVVRLRVENEALLISAQNCLLADCPCYSAGMV